MAHEMSDEELQRRRKIQSKIGRTTSTMGLAGVGLIGTAIGMHKSPAFEAKVMRTPGLRRLASPKPLKVGQKPRYPGRAPQTPEDRTREAAQNVGVVAGGIGGIGGFNQASIYSAESKRKKVSKAVASYSDDYDIAPTYGEVSKLFDTAEQKRGTVYGAVGGVFHAPGAAVGAAAAAPSGKKLHGAAAGALGGFVGGPVGGGAAGYYAGSLHNKGHLKKVKGKKQIAKSASAFGITHD